MARGDFQRNCARVALAVHEGPVLNVGCNEDPCHIKAIDPERVVNCDLFAHDSVMDRPNQADVLFDCARDRWPFGDGEACLVILGDIIEHLEPDEIKAALTEARRVGRRLCVTVPCDERDTNTPEEADKYPRGAVHRTVVTGNLLLDLLEQTGWEHIHAQTVNYEFVPVGFFVEAT